MTDERIIELFFDRDEQAIRECMALYGSYCHTVAANILDTPGDAEEAVADAWMDAWNAIPPQKPQYLRLFLGRLTRNRAITILRRNSAYRRGGDARTLALEELQDVAGSGSPEEALDMKRLSGDISAFLKTEPKQRRIAFVRRYFYLEDVSDIAEKLHLKDANVRMMLSRTRQRLKLYLKQEGYDL